MAIFMKDAKSDHLLNQTLACLVQSLRGQYTVIDFRNESSVRGKIVNSDGYMNVEMEDCIFQNPRGEYVPFETFFVTGRNIRYVHIPKGSNPVEMMEALIEAKRNKLQPNKKRTFKEIRSKRYQQEILQEIKQEQINEPSTSTQ